MELFLDLIHSNYQFIAGFAFLYLGWKFFSEKLQFLLDQRITHSLSLITGSSIKSALVGFYITCVASSSTVTSSVVVSHITAGLMNLRQAMGFVLGINIGATLIFWLFTLPIFTFSFLLMGLGVLPLLLMARPRVRAFGILTIGLGLLLWGFENMYKGVPSIFEIQLLEVFVSFINSPEPTKLLFTACFFATLTAVLRSSFLVISVILSLLMSDVVGISPVIAGILGANLGTTISILHFSSISNVTGMRVARFHLSYNLLIFIVGMILLSLTADTLEYGVVTILNEGYSTRWLLNKVISGNSLINVVPALLLVPSIELVERFLSWWVKDKNYKEPQKLLFLASPHIHSSVLQIELVYLELKKMAAMVQSVLDKTMEYMFAEEEEKSLSKKVIKYEKITDNIRREINIFIEQLSMYEMTDIQAEQLRAVLKIADELEKIADKCENIIRQNQRFKSDSIVIDLKTWNALKSYSEGVLEYFNKIFANLSMDDKSINQAQISTNNKMLAQEGFDFKRFHMERLSDKALNPEESIGVSEIFYNVKAIKSSTSNIYSAFH